MKVKSATPIQKMRRLPLVGKTLVTEGDKVDFDTIVARTELPGDPQIFKISRDLGVDEEDLGSYMRKNVGDHVQKGEIIAERKGFFGLFHRTSCAGTTGTVEHISRTTGQVTIVEPSIPLEISAYIPGIVSKVISGESVVIETVGALIQGIFGVGGENHGQLEIIPGSKGVTLTSEMIENSSKNKILVYPGSASSDALRKAVSAGAKGLVVGGIDDRELSDFLGYEIGVAITGEEEIETTIVITEGFGRMEMSKKTSSILSKFEGHEAAINGATQIRAGVIRPEVIIPRPELKERTDEPEVLYDFEKGMQKGMSVRVIRRPFFGRIGTIVDLPVDLVQIETESQVRVVEVLLEDGQRAVVPRADVEIIEE